LAGSGFPGKKGRDGGINRKKLAGKWDLKTLLWTLKTFSHEKREHKIRYEQDQMQEKADRVNIQSALSLIPFDWLW